MEAGYSTSHAPGLRPNAPTDSFFYSKQDSLTHLAQRAPIKVARIARHRAFDFRSSSGKCTSPNELVALYTVCFVCSILAILHSRKASVCSSTGFGA